jgi:hypothetical protein
MAKEHNKTNSSPIIKVRDILSVYETFVLNPVSFGG